MPLCRRVPQALNPNLTLSLLAGDEGIKIASKSKIKNGTASEER